jgi:hypothetical protein
MYVLIRKASVVRRERNRAILLRGGATSAVHAAMPKGGPMIAGFSNRVATQPLRGIGLAKAK